MALLGDDLRGVPALEAYLLGEMVADHGDILLNACARRDLVHSDPREQRALNVRKSHTWPSS